MSGLSCSLLSLFPVGLTGFLQEEPSAEENFPASRFEETTKCSASEQRDRSSESRGRQ